MRKDQKKPDKNAGWYYRLSLERKRAIWGVIFLLPWLMGLLFFFVGPLFETVIYSFSSVRITEDGIVKDFIGIANYSRAFLVNPLFNQFLITMVTQELVQVAIVIIFSLLSAMLINGKYPGRGVIRAIFFIPIIMGTNIAVSKIAGNDAVTLETTQGVGFGGFSSDIFIEVLYNTGLPVAITGYVTSAVSSIFQILANSGVPILIFLAGLQSISPSLYEVAKIEGSSQYEAFWKVTLPMISPMILLSTVYTIVDAFARHSITTQSGVRVFLDEIKNIAFSNNNYGLASAMSTVYMLASLIIVVLVTFLMSKLVFYYD